MSDGQCHGTQYRNVSCVTQKTSSTPPLPCGGPQPARESPCSVQCPQDCAVGPWGRWTPCKECGKLQSRNRAVVVPPSNGGEQCPRLTEVRICEEQCNLTTSTTDLPTTTSEPVMPWLVVGEWSDCSPLEPIDPLNDDNRMLSNFDYNRKRLISETSVKQYDEEQKNEEENPEELSGDGIVTDYLETQNQPTDIHKNKNASFAQSDATVKNTEPMVESTVPEYDSLFMEESSGPSEQPKVGTQTRSLTCQSTEGELPLRWVQINQ